MSSIKSRISVQALARWLSLEINYAKYCHYARSLYFGGKYRGISFNPIDIVAVE